MRELTLDETVEATTYFEEARKVAEHATCLRAKCGAVIVNNGKVIGRGYNSPPGDKESQRRCNIDKTEYDPKITDKTCCVHAEQRAVMDALVENADLLPGSQLYFMRVTPKGDRTFAGDPYCTICSKMVVDTGISEFLLWHSTGICAYDTEDYNNRSFEFRTITP